MAEPQVQKASVVLQGGKPIAVYLHPSTSSQGIIFSKITYEFDPPVEGGSDVGVYVGVPVHEAQKKSLHSRTAGEKA